MRVVVTGAGSGIGLATARRFAAGGDEVWALDLQPPAAQPGITPVSADVTDGASIAAALAELDRLDVLVNNAGIGAVGTVEETDDEEWRRVFEVNVLGMVRMARVCLPVLRRSEHAAIVNVSSVVATVGLPRRAAYGASKGAVYALTMAMAADHVADGIRVNCVCPGTVGTPWVNRLLDRAADPAAERAALIARQPIGRLGTADEVAAAIHHLASPDSGYTTGTALFVDGGISGFRVPAR